jgi:hypothetical protein
MLGISPYGYISSHAYVSLCSMISIVLLSLMSHATHMTPPVSDMTKSRTGLVIRSHKGVTLSLSLVTSRVVYKDPVVYLYFSRFDNSGKQPELPALQCEIQRLPLGSPNQTLQFSLESTPLLLVSSD